MNTRMAGLIIGVAFLLVGVLGFIPNPLISAEETALFKVNTLHNLVHLISGGVVLVGVYSFGSALGLKIIGVVYALVAVLGFIMGGDMLGMAMNTADHYLHVFLAVVILLAGFALPDDQTAAARA